ncbi:MAG: hypothetical protein IKQ39_03470 [Oscillospiraceae bacterium]|nr:hypothetical protein [Oscillospiraceae bacterium]
MRPISFLKNALFACLPAGLLLTGCAGAKQEERFSPAVDAAYSVQAEMSYGDGEQAVLVLTRSGAEQWEAAFSDPPTLAGVVLSFDGNAVAASYKGLSFTVPKSALPAKNMLVLVTEVLDSLDGEDGLPCVQQEDGTWLNEGDCGGGQYSLYFTEGGTPAGFDVPSQPLHITFSEYTACLSETAETTAVTEAASTVSESTASESCAEAEKEGTSE